MTVRFEYPNVVQEEPRRTPIDPNVAQEEPRRIPIDPDGDIAAQVNARLKAVLEPYVGQALDSHVSAAIKRTLIAEVMLLRRELESHGIMDSLLEEYSKGFDARTDPAMSQHLQITPRVQESEPESLYLRVARLEETVALLVEEIRAMRRTNHKTPETL